MSRKLKLTCNYCGVYLITDSDTNAHFLRCKHCNQRDFSPKVINLIDYYEGTPDFVKDVSQLTPSFDPDYYSFD